MQPYINEHMEALDWPPRSWEDEIPLPAAPSQNDWNTLLADREFRNILFNRFIGAGDSKTYWHQPLLELAEAVVSRLDLVLDRTG